MRTLTVAVCGYGNRGSIYATGESWFGSAMKVVAAADIRPERLALAKERHHLPDDRLFASGEEMLQKPRMADLMVISTQDQQHCAHAIAALEQGYHLLLEKPISTTLENCLAIAKKAKEVHRTVLVCHVLRYSPLYTKLREMIREGKVGDVYAVDQIENVGYYHMAHSFVRGNWHSKEESAPMILAKSCHDLDILPWLVGKKVKRLSSFGHLSHFTSEHAPAGSAERCLDCAVRMNCPYDAVHLYYEGNPEFSIKTAHNTGWPVNVLCTEPTEEKVLDALRFGPYGQCAYRCHNDVVDHQTVNLECEDDVTITFSMVAFTDRCTRTIQIMGTRGQINADMDNDYVTYRPFKGEPVQVPLDTAGIQGGSHGGSDYRMMEALLDHFAQYPEANGFLDAGDVLVPEVDPPVCVIDDTLRSHIACFAAEDSRLEHGKLMELNL